VLQAWVLSCKLSALPSLLPQVCYLLRQSLDMRNKWLFRPQVSQYRNCTAVWCANSCAAAGRQAATRVLCFWAVDRARLVRRCISTPLHPPLHVLCSLLQHSPEQLAHLPEGVTWSDVQGEPFVWQPQASFV